MNNYYQIKIKCYSSFGADSGHLNTALVVNKMDRCFLELQVRCSLPSVGLLTYMTVRACSAATLHCSTESIDV